MKRPSRMKFQVNKLGYYSLLAFVVANIVYTVMSLQKYPISLFIGFDTAINIVLLLFGFLAAVKLKLYDKIWCYIALGFALLQGLRIFLIPASIVDKNFNNLVIVLLIGAAFAALGALVTLRKIFYLTKINGSTDTIKELVRKEKEREAYLKEEAEQKRADRKVKKAIIMDRKQAERDLKKANMIEKLNLAAANNDASAIKKLAKIAEEEAAIAKKIADDEAKQSRIREIKKQKNLEALELKKQNEEKALQTKLAALNEERAKEGLEPVNELPVSESDIDHQMDGALLRLIGVDKIYSNNVQAVFNFNLDIMPHDFVVLVGPSGCGKSTTLRMIAGLESISKGKLILDGKLINKKAPAERDIAMIFQDYALYGHMSVYDNIGFSLKVRKEPANYIHDKVVDASEFVKLQPELNRLPKNLSGGQRQRVALGRSIVRNAKIFLMDEPLSNLDAKLRDETRKEIVKLHHNLNATIVYVTHDQIEAMTMATKIVVMNLGYIQQIGSPIEVYSTPNNLFVAGFIGSPNMNFITGRIVNKHFVCDQYKFLLDSEQLELLKPYLNSEIVLGVRPDAFTLDQLNIKNNWAIDAHISFLEYYGANTSLRFKILDKDFNATIRNRQNLNIGDSVTLSIIKEKVHFFDADSTLRITNNLNCLNVVLKDNKLYYDLDSYLELDSQFISSKGLSNDCEYELKFRSEAIKVSKDGEFNLVVVNVVPNNNVYATTLKAGSSTIHAIVKGEEMPQLESQLGISLDFDQVTFVKKGV